VHVVLYSRDGCHLCDEARRVLVAEQGRTPFSLEEIDIETSSDLVREYGIRIPVVVVDGREAFEYTVDAEELAAIVRGPDRL
jgi:glutaredoxin